MATYVNSRRAIHQGRTAAMIPGPLNPVIPKPGGTPVPIPNLAHGPGLQNGTASVKIDGKPVSVAGSRFDSHPATPDRLGGISGVTSQVVGGAAEPTSYSGDTKFEGRGAVRSFDTTKSNSMVINPGRAISWILSWLPEPYEKLAHKVLDKLPAAFGEQLAALGDSLTDPASLIGPALKLLAKFIPGLNAVVGGAAMAQAASEMSALAGEVEALLTPPLTDAKLDQIADLIADQVAATSVGFVTGKATRALRKLKPPVKRIDNNVNPNTTGKIIDDAKPSMPAAAGCELGTCTPVIFATGVKIISAEDFALPGLVPLDWTRFYRSSDRRAGWLGYGWSTPLSVELVLVYGQLHYYDERGRLIRLPALARGAAHFDARHKFTARRDDAGRYSLTRTDGTRLDFGAPRSGQWRLPLLRLSDRNDNAITLHYPDFDGAAGVAGAAPRPLGLTDSAGRRLQFVWTNDELLAEVRLQDGDAGAADGSLVLVRYAYDRDGNEDGDRQANLVAAADALGGINHYRYQQHLMVAYTTKNGFTHHQQWSRLDAAARVVRTWTDEPGLLDTRFDYDIAAQVTHVTDALGRTSSYHYNGNHEVVAIDEPGPDGHPVRTETPVDEAGNPLASVDALGRVTRYAFDERGNLISVTDAAGAVSRFGYDQLNLPVEVVDALGHRWRNRYDERGNLLEHEDALVGPAKPWRPA